jgi:ankyrin repeat protein
MTFWLLDHGANFNQETIIIHTPLSMAIKVASPDLDYKLIKERGGDTSRGELLYYALNRITDMIPVLAFLIDNGAPLNDRLFQHKAPPYGLYCFMNWVTPLFAAASAARADAVRYLLSRGADRRIKCKWFLSKGDCAEAWLSGYCRDS